MDYTIGVDVGSRGRQTSVAVVEALYAAKGDASSLHTLSKHAQSYGSDVRLGAVVDTLNPHFRLRYLHVFPGDADPSKTVDDLILLHTQPQLRDNVEIAFAVNSVGQSFVNQFRHRCRIQNVFSRPLAVYVAPGVGYTDGDRDNPARLGVEELLSEVAVLLGSGHVVLAATQDRFKGDLLRAFGVVNTVDVREHYNPDFTQDRRAAAGVGLLYALALAVWRYRHGRPGVVR